MSPTPASRPARGSAPPRRAQTGPAARRALRRGQPQYSSRLVLHTRNYVLLAAGAVSIVFGFILLANKEISLAPALLVLGYCVLIPAGFLWEHVAGEPGQSRPGPGGEGE